MEIELNYPQTLVYTGIKLTGKTRLALLKTKQLFCSHEWAFSRLTTVYAHHYVQTERCSKCKKTKKTNYKD